MQESHSIACAMQVVTIKTSLVSNAQLEVAERTDLRCSLPKSREVRQVLARLRWQSCGNVPAYQASTGCTATPHGVLCQLHFDGLEERTRQREERVPATLELCSAVACPRSARGGTHGSGGAPKTPEIPF